MSDSEMASSPLPRSSKIVRRPIVDPHRRSRSVTPKAASSLSSSAPSMSRSLSRPRNTSTDSVFFPETTRSPTPSTDIKRIIIDEEEDATPRPVRRSLDSDQVTELRKRIDLLEEKLNKLSEQITSVKPEREDVVVAAAGGLGGAAPQCECAEQVAFLKKEMDHFQIMVGAVSRQILRLKGRKSLSTELRPTDSSLIPTS